MSSAHSPSIHDDVDTAGTSGSELPVSIQLLGEAECRVGETSQRLSDARVAVLLAMIALDGPQPRLKAAELFWPQSASSARANLRVLLHRVQRNYGGKLFSSGDLIDLVPGVAVDLRETDGQWIARCLRHGVTGLRLLASVELPGELVEAAAWLDEARARVGQRLARALIAWFESPESASQLSQAMALAEALIELNPLSEVGYRALMRAMADNGDRSAALAVFERCRQALQEQLGTSPDPQTVELHRELLRRRDDLRALAQRHRLVQRESELEQITSALAKRRVVIVEGPSGIGKSALLQRLAGDRGDFYWRVGAQDSAAPLAAFRRSVAQMLELARTKLGADAAPVREAETLLERFNQVANGDASTPPDIQALVRPAADVAGLLRSVGHGALVLDDLHLCDDESLELLSELLNESARLMPWCDFVLAYRPMRARRRLRAMCEKLAASGRLKLLQPTALTHGSVAELLADLGETPPPDLVERLIHQSGGSPAIVVGQIDAWLEGAEIDGRSTPALRSLLLERFRSCSSTAEGIARLASVAGDSFSVGLAASITGLSSWRVAEKWNELLLAGVFDARGFAFPLMESVVYDSVPETVRQFMHGEVAAALEGHGASAAQLSHHWRKAGDLERSGRFALRAAAGLVASGAIEAAISTLEPVFLDDQGQLLPLLRPEQVRAVLQASVLYLQLGRIETIPDLMSAASAACHDPLERGVNAVVCARMMIAMRQWEAAQRACASALPLFVSAPQLEFQVACWAALAALHAGGSPRDFLASGDLDRLVRIQPGWTADTLAIQTPQDWADCTAQLRTALGVG